MTTIEWTKRPGTKGETWNPIRARNRETGKVGWFCTKVNGGCDNCYAERWNGWRGNGVRYAAQDEDQVEIYLDETVLMQPLHWRKPRTVFVCSMTDLYAPWVPDEWLDRIKAVEALCPQHTFIELTKRAERAREWTIDQGKSNCEGIQIVVEGLANDGQSIPQYLNPQLCSEPGDYGTAHWIEMDVPWPLPNVWHGGSCHDQASAEAVVPDILATPAAVRWLSIEPQIGPVDLTKFMWPVHAHWPMPYKSPAEAIAAGAHVEYERQALVSAHARFLNWVIVGGESGNPARPFDLTWARKMRDDCKAAGVAYFLKQLGSNPDPDGPWDGVDGRGHMTFDRKGGTPDEWPPDLRTGTREFPAAQEPTDG